MTAQNSLPRTRHEQILRHIALQGSVSAAVVAKELGVSQVTIRRDIVELESRGRLVRVHGGAIATGAPPAPQSARVNVGVVVPTTAGHFPGIVRGMDAASHSMRARVVLATSQYRPVLEERQVQRLIEAGISGLIIAPTLRDRSEEELAEWASGLPVPVVFLERRLESTTLAAFDSARTDHSRGAMLAVEHFARLGHTGVGLAVFDRTPTAPLIREGHARAVERLGLTQAPIRMLPKGDEDDDGRLDAELLAFLDECRESNVHAALVHTDVHAARLVELASDRGVSVPGDLSLIAYDDDTAGLAMVPLSAITAPRRDLGFEAMRIVTERIAEPVGTHGAARHITMLPQLTVRTSCGAAG